MNQEGPFLVVGESVVDLVEGSDGAVRAAPGGSPANVAVALGRLGSDVTFVTELGADAGGDLIRGHLAASRVDVLAQHATGTPSARTRVDVMGVPSYEFDLGWSLRPPLAAPESGIVHLGSLGAVLQPGAAAVSDLLDRLGEDVVVSYDPNARPALMGDRPAVLALVEALVARADIVKASAEDLDWLYPGEKPEVVATRWQAGGPALVVVTLGAAGAAAVTRNGLHSGSAVKVDVVDTIGAGDSFMAGLLHRLSRLGLLTSAALPGLSGGELADALGFAAGVAAVTCSRAGADPPWQVEVAAPVLSAGSGSASR